MTREHLAFLFLMLLIVIVAAGVRQFYRGTDNQHRRMMKLHYGRRN